MTTLSIEDRIALQDLIAAYSWALDTGDADAHGGDQQHPLAPFHRGRQCRRVVEVRAADMRPALGELGERLRSAREEHQVLGRHALQQHFRRRIAELAGRAGHDDLAHESLPCGTCPLATTITSVTIEAT